MGRYLRALRNYPTRHPPYRRGLLKGDKKLPNKGMRLIDGITLVVYDIRGSVRRVYPCGAAESATKTSKACEFGCFQRSTSIASAPPAWAYW